MYIMVHAVYTIYTSYTHHLHAIYTPYTHTNNKQQHHGACPLSLTLTQFEDGFIVGFGIDYAECYRSLPYIGILSPSVYTNSSDSQ